MSWPGNVLSLRAGDLTLALRPDIGASVAGLWLGGLPVLRSVEPASLAQPRAGGCFALVPYSNRLGHRRFRWRGRDYRVEPNFEGSPHALHGVAWLRAWEVADVGDSYAELRLVHRADDDWPFHFEVHQRFALTPQAVELSLAFANADEFEQPVGLGWHPYFPKRARSRLHIEIAERWEASALQLPTRKVAQPGIDADVVHLDFDHCFEGWSGAARIRDEKLSLRLTSSLPRLIVFTPRERDFFCVEPVSHVPNAIHMTQPLEHGLVAVAPGQSIDAWMKLEIAAA